MKRSVVETILGLVVIIIAGLFLYYSYQIANFKDDTGYTLEADFSTIGGLSPGDDVVVSGVKVGQVSNIDLVKDSYLARVFINVDKEIQLPRDTAAVISSESLLGGRYLALEPGADEEFLKNGERIAYTQSPQNLEQLLGQFIFSVQDSKNGGSGEENVSGPQSMVSDTGGASGDPYPDMP